MKHIKCTNCGWSVFRRDPGWAKSDTITTRLTNRRYVCCCCLVVIDLSNRPAIEVADVEAGIRLTEEETDDDQDRREGE